MLDELFANTKLRHNKLGQEVIVAKDELHR
jgi:hypothetical protein